MRKIDFSRLKTTEPVSADILSFFSSTLSYANSSANGLVRIVDSTANTSATIAASANSVKAAFDLATTANSGLATAYANSITYTNSAADTAYTNAVSYAAANTYVNTQLGLKANLAGALFTGAVSISNTLAAGNTTIDGSANVAGTLQVGSTLTVAGNLVINGTTTTINTSSINVTDSIIYLAVNNEVSDTLDIGFGAHYNNGAGANGHTGLVRSATTKKYYLFQNYRPELYGNNNIDVANTSTGIQMADIVVGNLVANSTLSVTGLANVGSLSTTGTVTANVISTSNMVANAIFINTDNDSNINDASSAVKLVINGDQHFPRQGAKIYFGDASAATPLSIGEGLQGDAGLDKDFIATYARNSLRTFTYANGNNNVSTEMHRVTNSGIFMGSEPYASYVKTIQTPNGGAQACRFIEDCLGRWVLVGKFAADASVSIGGIWSSVRGLSTSTAQSDTTAFSADWGDSYPTEVRVMGATDFGLWKPTRTIDFIYRVPSGRNWATFFNNGSTTMDQTSTRFGFGVAGAYDGFGRWNNPSMSWVGMSDSATTNPASAYTTPTTNAFNWYTAQDAKLTAIHTGAYSGQDFNETVGFGYDDSGRAFADVYPSTQSNMNGGLMYSSAVWILIKLN